MPEIGADRKLGGLVKTGQTTQYGGYADDGYYEKGLSKLYTILTAGRYSGSVNITLNAKTDAHSNNCVLDRRTKLMWSRYVAASVGPGSDGKLPFTENVNGEGIFAFAAAANAALLAGHSDWRVPNVNELLSLRDYEAPTCAPDSTAFPGWPINGYVHSSTTRPDSTTSSVIVHFSHPTVTMDVKTSNLYCALVRGG